MGNLGYENIIGQLQRRSELELGRPQTLDIGTNVVKRVDQELTAQREFEKKMSAEGRVLVDDSKIEEFVTEVGDSIPPEERERFRGLLQRFKGLRMKPEEIQTFVSQEAFALTFEDSQKQAAARVDPKAAAASIFPKPTTMGGGKQTITLRDKDNVAREVPLADYMQAVEMMKASGGSSVADFIDFSLYGEKAYKATTAKNPRDGELVNIYDSGKTTGVTGAAPKKDGQALKNDIGQLSVRDRKQIDDTANDVQKDSVVKKLRESSANLEAVKELVSSGNEAAVAILPFRIIRSVGFEVGALNRQDVEAGGGTQELFRKAQRQASIWSSGKLPPEDVKDFIELTLIADKVNRAELDKAVGVHMNQLLKRMDAKDVDPEFVKQTITMSDGPTIKKFRNKKTNKVHNAIVDSSGKVIKDLGEVE